MIVDDSEQNPLHLKTNFQRLMENLSHYGIQKTTSVRFIGVIKVKF